MTPAPARRFVQTNERGRFPEEETNPMKRFRVTLRLSDVELAKLGAKDTGEESVPLLQRFVETGELWRAAAPAEDVSDG